MRCEIRDVENGSASLISYRISSLHRNSQIILSTRIRDALIKHAIERGAADAQHFSSAELIALAGAEHGAYMLLHDEVEAHEAWSEG